MDKNAFLAEFKKYLKGRSLPFTQERETAVNLISDIESHFTVENLLAQKLTKDMQVSRATLYRTIQLLLDAGLLTRLSRDDKAPLYETLLDRKPHNHFLCNLCGNIIEFHSNDIENSIKKISIENGFRVESHSLKIFGLCPACLTKNK